MTPASVAAGRAAAQRKQQMRQRFPAIRSAAIAAAACVALLAGCATPPPPPVAPAQPPPPRSYVVLMEDLDGRVGSVVVRSGEATVVLERRLQAAELRPDSPRRFEPAPGQIERDFAAAIGARAQPAEIFRLYFATSAAKLAPESERVVDEILDAVRRRPAPDVSIIGHTDTVGEDAANERLGLQRAQWVARLLRQRGLEVVELTVASHGERDPLVPTPDATDEPRNRRVEVIVR